MYITWPSFARKEKEKSETHKDSVGGGTTTVRELCCRCVFRCFSLMGKLDDDLGSRGILRSLLPLLFSLNPTAYPCGVVAVALEWCVYVWMHAQMHL